MRKHFITLGGVILSVLLLFSGCQKQINEPPPSPQDTNLQTESQQNELQRRRGEDNCQFVHLDWGDGTFYHYHYNNKGLADEWVIDYGDGLPDKYSMEYDRHDKLSKGKAFFTSSNNTYNISFIYDGDKIVKEKWRNTATNAVIETINTYNRRGQMTRRDDITNDIHARLFYNDQGNNSKVDFYQGDILIYRGIFTFNIPNRNPYLAVNGVPYGFPYYTLGPWDERWETSDKIILYDGSGNGDVIIDYDPSRTRMQTGTHNYLASATYYDRVSQTSVTNTFTYQNCGEHHGDHHDDNYDNRTSSNKSAQVSTINKLRRILSGPAKEIKKQLMQLRKEINK
jgi:hypothetical protein